MGFDLIYLEEDENDFLQTSKIGTYNAKDILECWHIVSNSQHWKYNSFYVSRKKYPKFYPKRLTIQLLIP